MHARISQQLLPFTSHSLQCIEAFFENKHAMLSRYLAASDQWVSFSSSNILCQNLGVWNVRYRFGHPKRYLIHTKVQKCVGQILPAAYSCGLLMATPVSTCCTQQLKDHQLISIFFKENYILLIKAQLPQLWYSVWIREGVSGISRRGTERLLTQSQPLCTVYSIAFPPEQREFHALVTSFGLNSWQISMPMSTDLYCSQSNASGERVLTPQPGLLCELLATVQKWMRKQVEILSSDCLSCTAEQLRPRAVSCFLLSRFKIASIRNNILIRGC